MPALERPRALHALGHGYVGPSDHLADELTYARRLLGAWWAARRAHPVLRAERLDDVDLDRFVAETPAGANHAGWLASARARTEAQHMRAQIDARLAATVPRMPLADLVERFELTVLERDVIVCLLAVELDRGFARAYAAMAGDPLRKRLDVGSVAELAGGDAEGTRRALIDLVAGGALERTSLVELEPLGSAGVMLRGVRAPRRIVAHVLGGDALDDALAGIADVVALGACVDDLRLDDQARNQLVARVGRALGVPRPRLVLRGPPGAGKKTIAAAAAAAVPGITACVRVDLAMLVAAGRDAICALRREIVLRGAGLYLDAARSAELIPRDLVALAASLDGLEPPIIIGCPGEMPVVEQALRAMRVVDVPLPGGHERYHLWRTRLVGHLHDDDELRGIAHRFPLTGGAIESAATTAVDRALDRASGEDPDAPAQIRIGDLIDGARRQLAPRLTGVATRITSAARWSDVVLPADILDRVRDIVRFAAQRRRVFDSWNFASRFPYGRGLSALFWGPPGTGKTMIASAIAGELGMELFRVDLSKLVSKWIGETEKNLARVFDEAQAGQTVLLFDEADSLFAPRTDVKSSNNRYANLEVNFLLQKMEDFEGVTILTTNFAGGIDEAFQRRLRFRVEFPFPDADERSELWRRMILAEAAIATTIDWCSLGDAFELAGGNIKNAVLHAAFTAAHRGDHITGADLHLAALLECREMGRVVPD